MAYLTKTRLNACKKNQSMATLPLATHKRIPTLHWFHSNSTRHQIKFKEGLKTSLRNQHATSWSLIMNLQALLPISVACWDTIKILVTHGSTCKHYSSILVSLHAWPTSQSLMNQNVSTTPNFNCPSAVQTISLSLMCKHYHQFQ